MWINVLLLSVLMICVITDVKSRMIYNKVIFPGLLLAFGAHFFFGGWAAAGQSLLGFAVGLGLFLIPYLLGGMGAGDVKLLSLIGALKGASFVLAAAVYTALFGAVMALLVLLWRKETRKHLHQIMYFLYGLRYGVKIPLGLQRAEMSATYPYGVAIAGGSLVCMVLRGDAL